MKGRPLDRYGVIGYPVSHSRSPVIHRLFAIQTKQNLQYELLQVKPEKLEGTINQFRRTGGKGLNVTMPHKNEVVTLVDRMSERAQIAGAVNTLVFRDDEIFGDNTDGYGLVRDLRENLQLSLRGKSILILGAGGATRGIVHPLLEQQTQHILIANRTVQKSDALAEHFGSFGEVSACRFDSVPDDRHFDLVVNATSAGFKGETPPYPASAVGKNTLCYDLSYGLTPTPFSEWGARRGASLSVMGWGMLVEQAAESFRLWRGMRPDTTPVLSQLAISA